MLAFLAGRQKKGVKHRRSFGRSDASDVSDGGGRARRTKTQCERAGGDSREGKQRGRRVKGAVVVVRQ